MPAEIVQHGGFDGNGRRPEIVNAPAANEPARHHRQLQPRPQGADAIEPDPPLKARNSSMPVKARNGGESAQPRLRRSPFLRAFSASPGRAAATARGPTAAGRRSGSGRSSSPRCARRRCAAPARRRPGTACRICRAPPCPAGRRSPSRESPSPVSSRSRSTQPAASRASRGTAVDLLVGERRGQLHRRQLRGVQDLVRVGVADAAEDARVGQRPLERVVLGGQPLRELPARSASRTSRPPGSCSANRRPRRDDVHRRLALRALPR